MDCRAAGIGGGGGGSSGSWEEDAMTRVEGQRLA